MSIDVCFTEHQRGERKKSRKHTRNFSVNPEVHVFDDDDWGNLFGPEAAQRNDCVENIKA